jgi:hypothetical protein
MGLGDSVAERLSHDVVANQERKGRERVSRHR